MRGVVKNNLDAAAVAVVNTLDYAAVGANVRHDFNVTWWGSGGAVGVM